MLILEKMEKMATRRGAILFLTSAIAGIAVLFYSSYYARGVVEENFQKIQSEIKTSEWLFLWGKLEQLRIQAKGRADMISREICTIVDVVYDKNYDKIATDLSNLDSNDNKIIEIANLVLQKSFMNLDGSDSDDPFIASERGILSDFSSDCSAVARSRSFDEEIGLHFNKKLAKAAISKIISRDAFFSPTGWQFTEPKNEKFIVEFFNEKSLQNLYKKYGLDALESFEFLEFSNINEKIDLAHRPYMTGRSKNEDSLRLIVVQGFNPVKQILNSPDGAVGISFFDEKSKSCEASMKSILSIFDMLLFIMVLVIIMVYLVGVSSIKQGQD